MWPFKITLRGWIVSLVCLAFPLHADYPIYFLLTHARATGTAFEQVIRTHDKIAVLHAPYLDAYLVGRFGLHHPFTYSLEDGSLTFADVTHRVFEMAKRSPVFVKESGSVLLEYIKEHPEIYANPQVKIAFLVRDPAKSILSYYKKFPAVDESLLRQHRQLWELFLFLKDQKQEIPIVIDSDELLKNPLASLNYLGRDWGLHFDESNLHWEPGYAEDWRLEEWYVEVANSTGLEAYRGDVLRNSEGVPEYLDVADEHDRLRLQEIYKIQNVYYQKLLDYAFRLIENGN